MERESALARNIVLALILSLAIIVIAVVIVIILFPPEPEAVPVFSANAERSGTLVYLYHDGGDQLKEGSTVILINGQEVPRSAITFLHGQAWPWTEGETIRIDYPGAGTPESVEVLYTGGDSQVIVYSTQFGIPPETPSVSPTPTATITEEVPPTIPTAVLTTPAPTLIQAGTPTEAPAAEPPVALFSGAPRQGEAPLTVQFVDRSTGSPDSWLWVFGDGSTATTERASHQYTVPGVYTVSLTVRNKYGTSTATESDYISLGVLPVAQFDGTPREGLAPLQVQFSDHSSGSPDQWSWNFGDGSGSSERNPSHLYLHPGDYTVSLMVANNHGSNTRIQTSYVEIISTTMYEIYLQQSRDGYLLPDGYFQFVVTGPGASIKIGGREYRFTSGDLVQLFPGDVSSGMITVNQNGIAAFSFSDVRMYVNGELVRTGIVSDIAVPSYDGLKSTITIVIPPGDPSLKLFVDGSKVPAPPPSQITIFGIGTDTNGAMFLSIKISDLTFSGGAEEVTS
jgi:PKD repeat protein